MSVEEDTELRDLVSKTLENNGVLAKIRAELRASVFLALEEQESGSVRVGVCDIPTSSEAPFENKALKEYLKSPQAALGLCIVREFLEYLELDFTLSVYNTETSHGKGYEYSGRNKLVKDLKLKNLNGKKGPLLSHILQIAQESCGVSVDLKEEEPHSSPVTEKLSCVENPHNNSHEGDLNLESPNVSLAPLDRTFTTECPNNVGTLSVSLDNDNDGQVRFSSLSQQSSETQVSKVDEGKQESSISADGQDKQTRKGQRNLENIPKSNSNPRHNNDVVSHNRKQNQAEDQKTKTTKSGATNPMTSLNDLPPLDRLQEKRNLNSATSINFDGLGLQDDYEEDFHSTDSSAAADENVKPHRHSKKSSNKPSAPEKDKQSSTVSSKGNFDKEPSDKPTNSPVGSISEEIDDTNSGIDDLLNSTASTENTVDHTISHIRSNFADYVEEI